jgi:predicted pyridoxine 5'-phosphate oxidase superfamily flavin-nucleotide-binding protein
MAKLASEMKAVFEKQLAVIATAGKDGTPNVGVINTSNRIDC